MKTIFPHFGRIANYLSAAHMEIQRYEDWKASEKRCLIKYWDNNKEIYILFLIFKSEQNKDLEAVKETKQAPVPKYYLLTNQQQKTVLIFTVSVCLCVYVFKFYCLCMLVCVCVYGAQ